MRQNHRYRIPGGKPEGKSAGKGHRDDSLHPANQSGPFALEVCAAYRAQTAHQAAPAQNPLSQPDILLSCVRVLNTF